ncbi:MAG: ion transporter [Clostridiales bacterium]|nr:ion transporter [Clostridiales bacterium]
MKKLKDRIYNLIRDDDENDVASNIFDGFIIGLIVLNVILVIAETFQISDLTLKVFGYIEYFSVGVFTIEYFLRVFTSDLIRPEMPAWKARLRYMVSFMAVIDLLAILPTFVPFIIPVDLRVLRMIRVIRLFRVFKFNRYTNAMSAIAEVFRRKKSQLISSIFVVGLLMIVASVLMYNIENAAQPELFSNAFSALWWAVATLTTVGYGDIYPVTVLGRILSAVIALLGIGLVAVPTGIITAGFTELVSEEKDKKSEEKSYCPYCGHKLDE